MKKYLVLLLLCVPMMAVAAPSVRVLGNQPSGNNTAPTKAMPAKSSSAAAAVSTSRIGTVRPKTKTATISSNKTDSESRFPAVTGIKGNYSNVVTLRPTGGNTVINTEVDTDAIVNNVMEQVSNDYYDKTEVYNNNEFIEAVESVDDPRIWSISTADPKQIRGKNAPEGWVYIWVED